MVSHLNILGIRGIPAAHGGFETFVAHFAPYMRDSGWHVTVYCQGDEGCTRPQRRVDDWEGIQRIHFDTRTRGPRATIEFDLKCTLDVLRRPGVDLVLGYNTAIFTMLQRLAGRRVFMNMDGIEWKRAKWGKVAKAWFWLNEWIGAQVCSVAIADHPQIANHLSARGCKGATVIPYGSERIQTAPVSALNNYGITPKNYFITIARIEPENSILEIIQSFVAANTGRKLIVLGKLEPVRNSYHKKVIEAANADVIFPGAIYDGTIVRALRFYCLAYVHGHQVGGTNPSLVEALGSGNAIIAHDNKFNRWVAGERQMYFSNVGECRNFFVDASDNSVLRDMSSKASLIRHAAEFQFEQVHQRYKTLLSSPSNPQQRKK